MSVVRFLVPLPRTTPCMLGDNESEIELADRAVALNPNSNQAWGCRGWVYRVASLPEEAVRSFERAMRMSPVDPLLHQSFTGMAYALVELGRFDEAIVAALALAMKRDISKRRATALMGISHSWTILAEQLRRLAQIEENERCAA